MKLIPLFLFFFVSLVLAQERLILTCDVTYQSEIYPRGESSKGIEKIQIDIESHPEGFGFRPWHIVEVKGSHNIELHFGSPPEGESFKNEDGTSRDNKSTNQEYFFYGYKKNYLVQNKNDFYSLKIDRVTGLVDGAYTFTFSPKVSGQLNFIGTCKKVDPKNLLF